MDWIINRDLNFEFKKTRALVVALKLKRETGLKGNVTVSNNNVSVWIKFFFFWFSLGYELKLEP